MDLTPRQRKFLKGLAHAREPIVRVGRGRITASVIAETKRSLNAHELIKVRIDGDEPEERRALAASLTEAADASLVATIGKITILYRAREEDPEIELP